MTAEQQALADVDLVPEHDLRRLLQRIAITDPQVIRRSVARQFEFDQLRRSTIPNRKQYPQ